MMKKLLKRFTGFSRLDALQAQVDEAKILAARVLINQIKEHGLYKNLHETEFKVFSQFGDDGIIQYLIQHVTIDAKHQSFIEFGVENYTESNTRFLLVNDNWRGLVMDADPAAVAYIRQDSISWKHELSSVCAFITRENINDLIAEHGFSGEVGLLSIDLDGNDYWIWEAIDVISPFIVIVEYNSVFGHDHAISIPYDPAFRRTRAHETNLFWGCSLKALVLLGEKKGYGFIGCNSAGNNAYFVRKDKLGMLQTTTPGAGYVLSRFRESRNEDSHLTYLSGEQRLAVIADMVVHDLETKALIKIKDLCAAKRDMT